MSTDTTLFLETARGFGKRLVDDAIWEGDACTWDVLVPDRSRPGERVANYERAGVNPYQGTSGIAFFLGLLSRYVDDDALQRTLHGAVRHAMDGSQPAGEEARRSYGFHSGPIGVAWILTVLDDVLDFDGTAEALRLIEPLDGHEHTDAGLDVIAGGAGAIAPLLQIANTTGEAFPADVAVRLGENLIQQAHREPIGWSWGTVSGTSARHLTGYAHGTAGIGQGLLELYVATGSERYAYAARQAFLYEDHFYDAESQDWPDFRNNDLGTLFRTASQEELAQRARSGNVPEYEHHTMRAWCHGSPGIALARIRAQEVFGRDAYPETTEGALEASEASVQRGGNYSLCHGIGGNCAPLLMAAETFGDDHYREVAEAVARRGINAYGKGESPWPCGTVNSDPDPSLMLGESGIGHFMLRLHDPSVPEVLIHRAPPEMHVDGVFEEVDPEPASVLRRQYVSHYFGHTVAVAEALDGDRLPDARTPAGPEHESDVLAYRDRLAAVIDDADPANGADAPADALADAARAIADASAPDRMLLQVQASIEDFMADRIAALARYPVDDVAWDRAEVQLADGSRLVDTRYDWEEWLASDDAPSPSEGPATYVVFTAGKKAVRHRLGAFGHLVLQSAQTPATVDELVGVVQQHVDASVPESVLREKVLEQVAQAYQRGILTLTEDIPHAVQS